ncbi:MAG: hypothetical protein P8012_04975, partial [Desulfobacterales bacterium]
FGLNSNHTCEDFRKAPVEAQINFLMSHEGLTSELQNEMIQYHLEDKVGDCFYNKVRKCSGAEPIGDMYRNCAESLSRY